MPVSSQRRMLRLLPEPREGMLERRSLARAMETPPLPLQVHFGCQRCALVDWGGVTGWGGW